jgi:predicted phosphate transport protein (TIGR00153 family)
MRLLPREEKFFQYFLEQASIITQASKMLMEGAKAGSASLATSAIRIRELEQKGDEIIHEIYTRLNSTFITPLDPEDLHSLSSHLDDVLDGIEDAVHRMVAYRVAEIPATMIELCAIINQSAESLQRAFIALSKNEKMIDHCIEVNRLEEVADQLVRSAVSDLFQQEKDPIQLMKLKEVYEFLEQTTDRCEDVADVLQNVVVKNS